MIFDGRFVNKNVLYKSCLIKEPQQRKSAEQLLDLIERNEPEHKKIEKNSPDSVVNELSVSFLLAFVAK